MQRNSESKKELAHSNRIRNVAETKSHPGITDKQLADVMHSMETALWCLANTASYEECVLKAVNLGDDTGHSSSNRGGLAGIYYG